MPTYEFKSIDEFVSYLDTRAKHFRACAEKSSPRSHTHAALMGQALECDIIANMVRCSNLVVVTDYMRAALSKGVG